MSLSASFCGHDARSLGLSFYTSHFFYSVPFIEGEKDRSYFSTVRETKKKLNKSTIYFFK